MFAALAKAFGQISDPAFRRVFALSLVASLGVFVAKGHLGILTTQ